jgi:hypothetical protein
MNTFKYYYLIKSDLSTDGEITLTADKQSILPNGELAFFKDDGGLLLALPPGSWKCVWAASMIDGSPISVSHWGGELIPDA